MAELKLFELRIFDFFLDLLYIILLLELLKRAGIWLGTRMNEDT